LARYHERMTTHVLQTSWKAMPRAVLLVVHQDVSPPSRPLAPTYHRQVVLIVEHHLQLPTPHKPGSWLIGSEDQIRPLPHNGQAQRRWISPITRQVEQVSVLIGQEKEDIERHVALATCSFQGRASGLKQLAKLMPNTARNKKQIEKRTTSIGFSFLAVFGEVLSIRRSFKRN
jgi:hypothetical protein